MALPPLLRRRTFLTALGAGLLVPRGLRAFPPAAPERKFLFCFCEGGWDTQKVFTPKLSAPYVQSDGHSTLAEVNGITFADSEQRPNVRSFFETWGDRTCVINGMEVSSITHERCRRIAMTGKGAAGSDDWPSTLAAHAAGADVLLPHVVLSGPAFTQEHTSRVIRAGSGQLAGLLSGEVLERERHTTAAETLEDAYVRARVEAALGAATDPRERRMAEAYLEALDATTRLQAEEDISFAVEPDGCNPSMALQAENVLNAFERGLARCAIVANHGVCAVGWDSHTDVDEQDGHFELLFGYLQEILADLETRTGVTGAPLSEEVTLVVMSEMGRDPRVNDAGGRDHWTYTSTMLIGAGVRGGQVIGGLTDDFVGEAIDLATGEITEAGTALVPDHLGATLYKLGGLDPAEHLGVGAIDAAIAD